MSKDFHLESFFIPANKINGNQLIIDGNEFRHLHKVKRKRVGDKVHATDGEGNFYTVQLIKIKATQAIAEIGKIQRLVGESLVSITLAQGLIKSQRMDWLIEKGTELGIRKFIPVQTDFCQTNPSDLKLNRWARVAQAAMKQCGRSILPQIEKKVKVKELADVLERPAFFAHPGVRTTVNEALAEIQKKRKDTIRSLSLLVGPEGGFSDDEVNLFKQWGFFQVQLGQRRLRSETAAITLITLTLDALGEI